MIIRQCNTFTYNAHFSRKTNQVERYLTLAEMTGMDYDFVGVYVPVSTRLNLFQTGYPFWGHQQTVQTPIRRRNTRRLINLICLLTEKSMQNTVELQWLEHIWNNENMFETGIARDNEC